MTATPWGDSDELRERRLKPGPVAPREEVDRNQLERLFGATVAVTTTKGYADTTVADLLAVSGVSRSSFYRHFDGKLACFLATMEEILSIATAVTASHLRRTARSWEEGAERALQRLLELVVAQPAAARLCLVEADAAGPRATAPLEKALQGFQALVAETFEHGPGTGGMPEEMTQAMVGGLRKMVHTRLRRGSERELLDMAGDLVKLNLSYVPPPLPLRERSGRGQAGPAPADAGPHSRDPGQRIARATLASVAAKGFPKTSIADIAAAANVSRTTFYECFPGKEQALASALFEYRLSLQAAAIPAYRRARSWPEAVSAAVRAACAFLASEPDFAEVAAVHIYAAGPTALERRDRTIESLQTLVTDAPPNQSRPIDPILPEAIVNSVYAMFSRRVQTDSPASLIEMAPLATYMILSPFTGADCACAVARGEGVEEGASKNPAQ